jgi:hypothetical protein
MAGIFETDLPSVSTIDKIRGTKARSSSNITPANLANQMAPLMNVIDGDGVVKLLPDWIIALQNAAAGGVLGYSTKAQMVAATPTVPATGVMRNVTNDPADSAGSINGAWRYDPGAGGDGWIKAADQASGLRADVATMQPKIAQAAAAANGLYLTTGAPRPVAWMDTSSYEVCWLATLTSPATRFTATPTVNGLTIVGLGPMPLNPIGVRLPTDIVPGDSFSLKGKFTAGAISTSSAFWIGVDTATSGNLSTSARFLARRGGILQPMTPALVADGARTVTPAFAAASFANGTEVEFSVDVQADYSLFVRVFQDGVQVSTDVVASPAVDGSLNPLHGSIIVGVTLTAGQTVTLSKLTRRANPGAVLYINSGIGASGDGTRGNPLKSLTDVPKAMYDLGIVGQPVTINCLSDNVYGYLDLKDTLSPKWTINGVAGGRTALNGFNFADTPTWTVVASTGGTVWTTPLKHAEEVISFANQVFVLNLVWNPRGWYTMPHKTLVTRSTANGGVDMAGDTAGSMAAQGGVLYLRLPDGMPSADPNAYPTGGHGLLVARTFNILKVVGTPEVNLNNIVLRWAAGPLFDGGSGFGVMTNCRFEWSGYNSPGIELHNGQFAFYGCKFKYIDGDCLGQTWRTDIPYQAGATMVTRLHQCELSHTGQQGSLGGDGISLHVSEDGTGRRNELWMTDCYVHDTFKCGVVPFSDFWWMTGCIIENCGTDQVSLFGVPTASAAGRTQRAYIRDCRIDPKGNGTGGFHQLYTDGMSLCETQLDGCWFGTPAGGGAELSVTAAALSGQTRDITKNRVVYRDCTTERASGSVVKTGGGTQGTFVSVAANALT